MDAKLVFSLVVAVVIGQAYSASYQDTFKACMTEFKLEKDGNFYYAIH